MLVALLSFVFATFISETESLDARIPNDLKFRKEDTIQFNTANTGKLNLVVAYCPTYFTMGGALVEIDLNTGNWSIVTTFQWPSQVSSDGCAGSAMDTPAYALDPDTTTLYLDFVNAFGLLVVLDLTTGASSTVTPSDDFFVGFENMQLASTGTIAGLFPTVTQSGFCSDGCFGFATLSLTSGQLNTYSQIPYKYSFEYAVMDDTHYFDGTYYWFQASYPLTPAASCSRTVSDLCLVSVDMTGAIKSLRYTNWTVYKYNNRPLPSGNLLTYMYGFDQLCNDPYNDFLFASVNLTGAKANPIACIPNSAVDQEDEWISSFSLDGSLFATASGDGDSGQAQLLVFDPTTGRTIFNNALNGLGQALQSASGVYWIWGVNFISASAKSERKTELHMRFMN